MTLGDVSAVAGVRRGMLVVLAGVVVALVLFGVSGWTLTRAYLGGPEVDVVAEGFDFWTGAPHGRSYRVDPAFVPNAAPERITLPIPEDMAGRRAIPGPVGFAVGALGSMLALARLDRRRLAVAAS